MTTDTQPELLTGLSPEDASQIMALGTRITLAPRRLCCSDLGAPADSLLPDRTRAASR